MSGWTQRGLVVAWPLRPVGHHQQHASLGNRETGFDQLLAGRIDPVGILDDHQHRMKLRQRLH